MTISRIPKPKRTWPLIALLLITLLGGGVWWGVHKRIERKAAIAALEEYWVVQYKSSCPDWLENVIGSDLAGRIFSRDPTGLMARDGYELLDGNGIVVLSQFPTIKNIIVTNSNMSSLMSAIKGKGFSALKGKGEHLEVLRSLPDLTKLTLTDGFLCGDIGLAHIAQCQSLETLQLVDSSVTDAGLQHLKGHLNLRLLRIWLPKVTPEAVDELREALPGCAIDPSGTIVVGW